MLASLLNATDLTAVQLLLVCGAAFAGGLVRGFSGFALSAVIMASLAIMIPPLQLIPVCWMVEFSASLVMMRAGLRDGDIRIAVGLVSGGMIGLPIALYLNGTWSAETSKMVALCIIIGLAVLQLLRVKATFLATKPGLFGSGVLAGLATGFASVGGMVVALYVLAREAPARMMRGSLVMYLFISNCMGFIIMWSFGLFDATAVARGLTMIGPVLAGVYLGSALFVERLEPYYKPFCLMLLLVLAGWGLLKLSLGL